MSHPYRSQPPRAFWKKTVPGRHPMDVGDWYQPRITFEGRAIATAGSCFAQHIGRALRGAGFDYIDAEPAPQGLPPEAHVDFGYGMYSARYGNVYTSRQLLQLLRRAQGRFAPREAAWEHKGGVVDPLRPTIEPEPFGSVGELEMLRRDHLARVLDMFTRAEVFVFTLGLTEAWLSAEDGTAFPLCPGTAGGRFDPARHQFRNLSAAEVRADMESFVAELRALNPKVEIFLTVSPVPLMATATQAQVAVASSYSKSVLRAVAGELCDAHAFIDYFPSYEIITQPFMQGFFYEADKREVSPHGVAHVMKTFFAAQGGQGRELPQQPVPELSEAERAERVKCDEELLAVFGEAAP
ncbi:GSCFA domain-containing protein [Citreicella sp. C3M06]|uniref:GSCFA domain-containing protein n=1 Tax=Citreicella sp. C3M06 TaxID=2841564 RepID=UPI001C0A4376|nr:GSCFA domain-containing protein [Citreicella sp. C3M06]MBU2962614.1 GSCFA domain-containing protein [Citreicella sp. C3M06]